MVEVISMCLNIALAIANGLNCTDVPTTPPPPFAEMAVRLTGYDTALCDPGEMCVQGDGDGLFASAIPVSDEWYGKMAACPRELYGRSLEILDMTVYCGDNFGYWNGEPVKTIRYDDDIGWYMHIDIFWPIANEGAPEWVMWFIRDWSFADATPETILSY